MNIKNVKITPVSPDNGLVAFASLTLDDDILLSSIAVYKKLDGGLRLLYPSKRVRDNELTIFHPLNREASRMIEKVIFKEFKNVYKEGRENDRYSSTGFGC